MPAHYEIAGGPLLRLFCGTCQALRMAARATGFS